MRNFLWFVTYFKLIHTFSSKWYGFSNSKHFRNKINSFYLKVGFSFFKHHFLYKRIYIWKFVLYLVFCVVASPTNLSNRKFFNQRCPWSVATLGLLWTLEKLLDGGEICLYKHYFRLYQLVFYQRRLLYIVIITLLCTTWSHFIEYNTNIYILDC